jgi:hypothetical protein
MINKLFVQVWGCLLIAVTMVSCVTSLDRGMDSTDTVSEDSDYYKAYQSATRGGDVIKNFGLEFRVHATYLYPEFRSKLALRLSKLYLQDMAAFSEADAKAAFFVTIYNTDRDNVDLTNTNHWTVLLETKDAPMRPVLIRKINDKKRWKHFFTSISPWTTEYLVVFDTASVNPGSKQLLVAPYVKMTIATAVGRSVLTW